MKDHSNRSFNWQETSPTNPAGTFGERQSRDFNSFFHDAFFHNASLRAFCCLLFVLSVSVSNTSLRAQSNLRPQSGFASDHSNTGEQVHQLLGNPPLGSPTLPAFPQPIQQGLPSRSQGTELRAQATLRAMPESQHFESNNSFQTPPTALPTAQPSWNQSQVQDRLPNDMPIERYAAANNLETPSVTPASYAAPTTNRNSIEFALPSLSTTNGSKTKTDLLDQPIDMVSQRSNDDANPASVLSGKSALITNTVIALMIVMVLIVGCAWLFKKAAPTSMQALPSESIQVLGNAPLTAKQHLKLVRLGNRLLLLAVSDTQSQTLAEVSDPDEVAHLLEIVKGKDANSAQQTFRSLLSESEKDRATGFLGSQQDRILARDTPAVSARGSRPTSLHSFEA